MVRKRWMGGKGGSFMSVHDMQAGKVCSGMLVPTARRRETTVRFRRCVVSVKKLSGFAAALLETVDGLKLYVLCSRYAGVEGPKRRACPHRTQAWKNC
jgi:hypothetical protein